MLNLTATGGRLCEGLRRRDILRIGSIGALGAGLGLPDLLASGATTPGRARSCIVVFLNGGPAQHSTWDPEARRPRGGSRRVQADRHDAFRACLSAS